MKTTANRKLLSLLLCMLMLVIALVGVTMLLPTTEAYASELPESTGTFTLQYQSAYGDTVQDVADNQIYNSDTLSVTIADYESDIEYFSYKWYVGTECVGTSGELDVDYSYIGKTVSLEIVGKNSALVEIIKNTLVLAQPIAEKASHVDDTESSLVYVYSAEQLKTALEDNTGTIEKVKIVLDIYDVSGTGTGAYINVVGNKKLEPNTAGTIVFDSCTYTSLIKVGTGASLECVGNFDVRLRTKVSASTIVVDGGNFDLISWAKTSIQADAVNLNITAIKMNSGTASVSLGTVRAYNYKLGGYPIGVEILGGTFVSNGSDVSAINHDDPQNALAVNKGMGGTFKIEGGLGSFSPKLQLVTDDGYGSGVTTVVNKENVGHLIENNYTDNLDPAYTYGAKTATIKSEVSGLDINLDNLYVTNYKINLTVVDGVVQEFVAGAWQDVTPLSTEVVEGATHNKYSVSAYCDIRLNSTLEGFAKWISNNISGADDFADSESSSTSIFMGQNYTSRDVVLKATKAGSLIELRVTNLPSVGDKIKDTTFEILTENVADHGLTNNHPSYDWKWSNNKYDSTGNIANDETIVREDYYYYRAFSAYGNNGLVFDNLVTIRFVDTDGNVLQEHVQDFTENSSFQFVPFVHKIINAEDMVMTPTQVGVKNSITIDDFLVGGSGNFDYILSATTAGGVVPNGVSVGKRYDIQKTYLYYSPEELVDATEVKLTILDKSSHIEKSVIVPLGHTYNELTFTDDDKYDFEAGETFEVSTVDISEAVSGGLAPLVYSLAYSSYEARGFAIDSATGVITFSRLQTSGYSYITVYVTDAKDKQKGISIYYGEVTRSKYASPSGLVVTEPTTVGGTGKITGLDPTLEYYCFIDKNYNNGNTGTSSISVPTGATEITGLIAGEYRIKVASDDLHYDSDYVEYTINNPTLTGTLTFVDQNGVALLDSDFVYNEYIYFNITDSNYKNTADFGGTNETNNFYAIEYSVDGGVTYTTRNYCNLKISHIYIGKTIKFRLSHERDGACEGSFEATTPTIKKADYDYTLPSGKKGEYGEALSEVVLGGDSYYGTFTWTDGTEVINTMGTFTSTITFTPSESYADRYNTITNIPLTITVEKGSVYQSTMDEKAIKNDQTSMQFDIEKVPTNIINPTFGTVEVLNNESLTNTQTIDSTGKISLTFNDLTDITDTTIGYKVKVMSDSYNDFYVRFSVKVTAKDIQSALTVATSDAKTTYVYGEAIQLVVGGGSGTGAISYAVTSGTATIDASGKVTGANVGDIVIKATKAGDDTYNAISQNITITITALEKTVVWSNLTAEQLIYDGNAKAYTAKIVGVSGNDIALSVAYTIKDTSTVESPINAQAYTATATLTADSNYSLANKTLDFTITPASASAYPNYAVPTGITATYGNTLEDVTLPASWSFDSALETAVGDYGNRTFAVTFDPVSTNYTAVGATVTIAVSKASGINASDYSVPTGLTATYGDTLADITLPTGWSFDRALTTAVGEAGTNTFSATFTSTNANYNVATQDVSIDVSKLALAKPTMASTSQNYNGQDITFVISGLDNTTMQTDSDSNSLTVKNAGNYAVYISLVDLNNYMWEDSSTSRVTLSYTINKVAITQDMIDTFVSSYKYTGSAITVTVNAKSGDILTDTDFEVCEYQNNIDVGTATFSIRAKADTNFNGGVSQTFSITQADNEWLADPSIEDWAFVATANVPDLGQVKFGTPYAKYTQITEQGNQSLGTTVPNTMGAYILTVVVDETDNFKGLTKDVAFNITEAITNKPTANTTVFTYNGTDQTYLPVGFNSATMSITNNIKTDAGTYSVTVAPISTYEWSDGTNSAMEFSFVIAKAQPTVETIAITATEGQKISDITLPSGWTFKEGTDLSASVGSVGNGASINIVLPETQNYVGTSQTVIITVQIDEAKAQALATAKTAKIAEINTLKATYNQADYRAEDWATIEAMFADAIQNINKASNLTNVESAVNLATIKTNANAVKTDSELTAEATKPTSPDDDGNKPTTEDSNKNSNLGLALGLGLGLPLGLIAIVVALLFLNKFGILGIAIIDKQKWLAFFHNSKKLHASAPILSPNEDIITPTNQSNNQETDSKDTNTKDTDS